jgi:RNA recognition motif-containing protein
MSLEEVRNMFTEHVPVKYINLPRNEETGEIKGFAFIDVESADDIPKAVEALNGVQVSDRPLRVSKVLEKDQIRTKKSRKCSFVIDRRNV